MSRGKLEGGQSNFLMLIFGTLCILAGIGGQEGRPSQEGFTKTFPS